MLRAILRLSVKLQQCFPANVQVMELVRSTAGFELVIHIPPKWARTHSPRIYEVRVSLQYVCFIVQTEEKDLKLLFVIASLISISMG